MIDATCPICGRRMQSEQATDWPKFPFCSPRCKTIDLGRWLSESYGFTKPSESSREPDEMDEEEDRS